MKITLVHPCIGHRRDSRRYLRLWEMEALQPALLRALTPADVRVRFYDDRLEAIPFDEPTDMVAMSVETYTAKRAYQIASEYRRRHVPVVMGGFHASLCPDEVARFAESVVVGEAEEVWPRLLDDYRHGTPQRFYRPTAPTQLNGNMPDRRVLGGKRYLPLGLVEAGRGCNQRCEFCAVQSMYRQSHVMRDPDAVVAEVRGMLGKRKAFFFVDDNLTASPTRAKELFRALMPLGIRWFGQATVAVAHDEELLDLMARSGCVGVLIGFESLNRENLAAMDKPLNLAESDYGPLIAAVQRRGLGIYGSFVFGYDHDTPASLAEAVTFAREHRLHIAAFNHLVPFPGTPLYRRLEAEGRLHHPAWWLADGYRFNQVPFAPRGLGARELERGCLEARRQFYSFGSIWERRRRPRNQADGFLRWHYLLINLMHQAEVGNRDGFPLGDEAWQGRLLPAE